MTAQYGTFPNQTNITPYANAAALAAVTTSSLYNGYRAQVNGLGVFKLDKDDRSTVDNVLVITAASGGRWLKDLTPSLLLNASNQIDGSQLVAVGVLSLDNGTAASPSLYFTNDTNLGIYRVAADTFGISTNGVLRWSVSTAAVISTLPLSSPLGAAATPTYSFTGDLNSGMYSAGADQLNWATNGILRLSLSNTALTSTVTVLAPDGAAATPSLRVTSEATGLFLSGAGILGFSIAGASVATLSASLLTSTARVVVPDGAAATPGIKVTSEESGLYLVGAGSLGVAIAGVIEANITASALNLAAGNVYQIAATQVVGPRATGWVAMVGAATTDNSGINTGTITATDGNIQALAQAVNGIQQALTTHGLIGT